MNFKAIEDMVFRCKNGDSSAKEEIIKEFRPFIINLSKRTFIDGYDFEDIQNECFKSLIYSIDKYKTGSNSFVKYGVMAVRNNINYLIRKRLNHYDSDGKAALIMSDNLEYTLESEEMPLDESLHFKLVHKTLVNIINNLNDEEKELIDFLYIKKKPLTYYSKEKNINYYEARYMHKKLLNKLKQILASKHIHSMKSL